MSIYFDFKTINELTRDDYYRQPKEFTLEDLSQYNGSNGKPTYVVIEGIVYDISNTSTFGGATHIDLTEGQDLTDQFNSCHEIIDILNNAPKVGVLIDDNYMNGMDNMNFRSAMPINRQIKQDTSKFTPDDWIRYIAPLVNYALRETTQGMNTQRSYQKFILLGVLVGLGKTPQEAINQVQQWQNTGASQLLKSGTNLGGTTTSGSMNIGGATGTGGGSGVNVGGTSGTVGGSGTNVGGTSGTGSSTNVGGTSGTGSGTNVGGTSGSGTGSGTNVGGTSSTGANTNKFNRLYLD